MISSSQITPVLGSAMCSSGRLHPAAVTVIAPRRATPRAMQQSTPVSSHAPLVFCWSIIDRANHATSVVERGPRYRLTQWRARPDALDPTDKLRRNIRPPPCPARIPFHNFDTTFCTSPVSVGNSQKSACGFYSRDNDATAEPRDRGHGTRLKSLAQDHYQLRNQCQCQCRSDASIGSPN